MLYMLALFMVSLPTSLARHLLVETADNQGGDDYQDPPTLYSKPPPRLPPYYDYSISPEGSKKNYKKVLTKMIDKMKRQGKDYLVFKTWGKGKCSCGTAWPVEKSICEQLMRNCYDLSKHI